MESILPSFLANVNPFFTDSIKQAMLFNASVEHRGEARLPAVAESNVPTIKISDLVFNRQTLSILKRTAGNYNEVNDSPDAETAECQ